MLYDLRRELKLKRAAEKVERAYQLVENLDKIMSVIRKGWCKGALCSSVTLMSGDVSKTHCWVGAIGEILPGQKRASVYAAVARHLPVGFRRPSETAYNALIRYNDDTASSGQDIILIMWQARMAAAQIAGRTD